jgi:tetratricopeptide (TPR) repeat protein
MMREVPRPEHIESLLSQLVDLDRAGHQAQASPLWRDALTRCHSEADLLLRLAAATFDERHDAGAQSDAHAYVTQAVASSPADPVVLTRAASLMYFLGDLGTAKSFVREASVLASPDFEYDIDLVHLAGRLAAAEGRIPEAREFLSVAFEEDPQARGHGEALARLYASQGESDAALAVVERALPHRPDDQSLRELQNELQRRS